MAVRTIGPFEYSEDLSKITLVPGTYKLKTPITFGIVPDTVLTNVTFIGDPSESPQH